MYHTIFSIQSIIKNESREIINKLLNFYDKVMVLKLYIDSDDNNLKNMYHAAVTNQHIKLNKLNYIDAGFDLFLPCNEEKSQDYCHKFETGWVNQLDFKICCSAIIFTDTGKNYNTGYYLYPRSSIWKTPLRLVNSTGIIDAGYRGHLIGMFDVNENNNKTFYGSNYDRYLQICAPGLIPIIVEIVESKEELGENTDRGERGFGSSGR